MTHRKKNKNVYFSWLGGAIKILRWKSMNLNEWKCITMKVSSLLPGPWSIHNSKTKQRFKAVSCQQRSIFLRCFIKKINFLFLHKMMSLCINLLGTWQPRPADTRRRSSTRTGRGRHSPAPRQSAPRAQLPRAASPLLSEVHIISRKYIYLENIYVIWTRVCRKEEELLFKNKKLWKEETKKRRNEETKKRRNEETKKRRNEEMKKN